MTKLTQWLTRFAPMGTTAKLVTVCAWCPDSIARQYQMRQYGDESVILSHGMCPSCVAKMEAESQERENTRKEYR